MSDESPKQFLGIDRVSDDECIDCRYFREEVMGPGTGIGRCYARPPERAFDDVWRRPVVQGCDLACGLFRPVPVVVGGGPYR